MSLPPWMRESIGLVFSPVSTVSRYQRVEVERDLARVEAERVELDRRVTGLRRFEEDAQILVRTEACWPRPRSASSESSAHTGSW